MARAPDADPAHATRPDPADPNGAADVRHRRQPLVGRLADLRQRPSRSPTALRSGERRQAAHRRPTACRRAELEAHVDLSGVGGELLGRARAAARALHARAQRDLRPPAPREHPAWSDDELYDKARLVNAALMAKIHTVEWTPAIIAHPTTVARHAGELVGPRRRAARHAVRPARVERGAAAASPARPTNHHGVPYALTEEFVAVYRMHPLIPDEFTFRSLERRHACCRSARFPSSARSHVARAARGARRCADALLLVRRLAPRRDHAAQLPALPAAASTGRTAPCSTSRRPTSSASASAASRATTTSGGCSTSSRVGSFEELTRQPRVGGGAARGLRRRRPGRPDDRPLRRAAARRASGSATRRSASSSSWPRGG